jgi:uncharacterized protein (TIGR02996 family)
MTTQAELLRAVLDAPEDDTVRLAYADRLEEDGDADRAEFIRTQIALAEQSPEYMLTYDWLGVQTRSAEPLVQRAAHLMDRNLLTWAGELAGRSWHVGGIVWRRGFIDQAEFMKEALVELGPNLFSHHPVSRAVVFTWGPDVFVNTKMGVRGHGWHRRPPSGLGFSGVPELWFDFLSGELFQNGHVTYKAYESAVAATTDLANALTKVYGKRTYQVKGYWR